MTNKKIIKQYYSGYSQLFVTGTKRTQNRGQNGFDDTFWDICYVCKATNGEEYAYNITIYLIYYRIYDK